MKRLSGLAIMAILLALPAQAAIVITQIPSVAPNAFGSPSWSGYVDNAMNSLENGLGNIGNINTDPTAYEQVIGGYLPGMVEVTSYSSWLGTANPGGAFAGELGNRIHFGMIVQGTLGSTFDLQDVSFDITSSDGALNYADNLAGTDFSTGTRVGIKAGGGVCDATHACSDTTLLSELFYVGAGNAFWAGGSDPDPANPLLGQQGALDDLTNYIVSNQISLSNQVCVEGTCNSVTLDVIPEPTSLAALIVGFVGLLGFRWNGWRRDTQPAHAA